MAVLGGLLIVGALLSGVAQRSALSLAAVFVLVGFLLGPGAIGVLELHADSGFVTDLASIGADPRTVPRRPRRRQRAPAAPLAGTAAQDHRRDAAHGRRRGVAGTLARRLELGRVVPARRPALPHRSRAVLGRGDRPSRAAADPPLAEPGVRAQRRAGAAGGARLPGGARSRPAATSSGGTSCCRTSASGSSTGCSAVSSDRCSCRATIAKGRSPATSARSTGSVSPSRPTA